MTQPTEAVRAIWRSVVEDILTQSERPSSGIPTLTSSQRLNLKLVEPIMIMDSYALLAAKDEEGKGIIESELGDIITQVLGRQLGRPVSVAFSVAPAGPANQSGHSNPTDNAPQTSNHGFDQPGHQASFDFAAQDNQSFGQGQHQQTQQNPHYPNNQQSQQGQHHQHLQQAPQQSNSQSLAPADATSQGTSADPAWQESVAPAGLDELADFYQRQQSNQSGGESAGQANRMVRETPAHDPNREGSLNPKHTFENFVIGSSNRFANGAAVAVAESPARAYNPLFIWGGSGLGKTHLLHAAGNYAQVLHPGLRVKYVSSEEFTNDYINSLRDDRQESFKRRYRNLDILMVDDIQFLAGKESTQEEFFHTFNALHQANKQIILSSDRPPKQLTTLEDRLRTRFEGGLITDIQPPDLETRIAILMKKAAADGTHIDRDVLELIASRFENSIRELEGALIRVSAYSSLVNEPINMEMAEIALRDLVPDSAGRLITGETIIDSTADYFNIDPSDLRGSRKVRSIAHPRQLAMYLCRELTELSLPKIGEHFGGKDHTTVMYAYRKIRDEMQSNPQTYKEIQELTSKIQNRH